MSFEYLCYGKSNALGFRPPLFTYRLNGPGEPPEDGEMSEITLPSPPPDKRFEIQALAV